MGIDSAEMKRRMGFRGGGRVLVAPFQDHFPAPIGSRCSHIWSHPNDVVSDWQLGLSGGTVVLAAIDPRGSRR